MSVSSVIKENRPALRFLIVFVSVYLILNTLYGLYINYYSPMADPVTKSVVHQTVWILSIFDPAITYYPLSFAGFIPIYNGRENVINVFEGCNGVNVFIVYLSFLIAYKGPIRLFLTFLTIGTIGIHFLNLLRISLLYVAALYFPQYLYFLHKYLFTGIIYVMVFVLWYFWTKRLKDATGE